MVKDVFSLSGNIWFSFRSQWDIRPPLHELWSAHFSHVALTLVFFVLSFSWTRNGTHYDIEKDPNVNMRPHSGTLVVDISRERAEHYEGVYQCTARNKHGTAVSNNIVIRQSRKCGLVCCFIEPFPFSFHLTKAAHILISYENHLLSFLFLSIKSHLPS